MAAEGQNVMQLSVYNAPVAAELMLQAMQRGELAGDARLLALTLAQFYAAQSTEQPKRCFTAATCSQLITRGSRRGWRACRCCVT